MTKLNKTILALVVIVLLLTITIFYLINQNRKLTIEKKQLNNLNLESYPTYREIPDIRFTDYENLDRAFCGLKTQEEILKFDDDWKDLYIENYKEFPDFAGYYLPKNIIQSVDKIDIDNDKNLETIIYYSCVGCNAPPRNVDIIKNNKIIFSAKGGNLEIKPLNNEIGFYLNTSGLTMNRADGCTSVKFTINDNREFNPQSEEDIKY